MVAVAVRFWCRYTLKTKLNADDWWILVTVVTFVTGQSAILWGKANIPFHLMTPDD